MLSVVIPAMVGLISGLVSAVFSHLLLIKKIRREAEEKLRFDLYNKQIDAYQRFWDLLGPTSRYAGRQHQDRMIKSNETGYFLDKEAIDSFFDSFHEFFYSEHGIFLSRELRNAFFQSRDYYYEIINSTDNISESCIQISNTKARKCFQAWDWVRTIARNDIGLRDVDFPRLSVNSSEQ